MFPLFSDFFTVTQLELRIFPARLSLMLPVAKSILADVKWSGALTIKSTPAFCKQSAPGAQVCLCLCEREIACLRQTDKIPTSMSCGNHFILPNITNHWNSSISMRPMNSHSKGANQATVINQLDSCQLCFLFGWNIPPPSKSITPPPSHLLSSYLWAEPGALDYGNIWPPTSDLPRQPHAPLNGLSPAFTQCDDSLKGDSR